VSLVRSQWVPQKTLANVMFARVLFFWGTLGGTVLFLTKIYILIFYL
jgi:hypothetical protein